MTSNKDKESKTKLEKANKEAKRAPVWVFAATNRKVRFSPKSRRDWRSDNIF